MNITKTFQHTALVITCIVLLTACASQSAKPQKTIALNPQTSKVNVDCSTLRRGIIKLQQQKTAIVQPIRSKNVYSFKNSNGNRHLLTLRKEYNRQNCQPPLPALNQPTNSVPYAPSNRLNFEQCFAKCKELTNRDNAACFDSCK